MIDIDKNLEIFYEREENKEDEYIGAISKHECVVDGWFVIELLEEVKRLREQLLRGVKLMNQTPNQTKEGRRNWAKRFEREVRGMIE